jgi:hypothetical protein
MSKRWILAFAAAVGLMLNFAVPPFHNPDEPLHFSIIVRSAWGDEAKDGIERDIIRMMDRAGWWRSVGMGRPDPLPGRFGDIPFMSFGYKRDLKDLFKGLLLYHKVAARVIGPLAGKNLNRFYYLSRAFSYALFLASLLMLYGGFRDLASGRGRKQSASSGPPMKALFSLHDAAPFLFILLLPQLLIVALSVGPDAWCVLLGAVFFRSALAVVRGAAGPAAFAGLWGAALVGLLSDKSTLGFILLALASALFAVKRANPRKAVLLALTFLVGTALVAYAVVLIFPLEVESNFIFVRQKIIGGLKTLGGGMELVFLGQLSESFFLRFGWMTFKAPRAVILAWQAVCLFATAGVAALFVRRLVSPERKQDDVPGGEAPLAAPGPSTAAIPLRVIAFAAVAVGFQVVLLRLATNTIEKAYSQGRYLFPLIMPLALLLVAGIRETFNLLGRVAGLASRVLFPRRAAAQATVGRSAVAGPGRLGEWAVWTFLLLEFLFLGWAVWNLVIPAFYLTRLSPHPGI